MPKNKCKLCERTFVDKSHLVKHIDKAHGSQIPEGWTAARYENYIRTGKTHGTCVICKENTEWNEATEKYCRMCGKQSCKDTARKIAEKNLLKTKGVTHSQMLSDPEFQRKMVYSKKTSGSYRFNDDETSTEVKYDSSYGKDFLEMLDVFMGFCGSDIMGPSPNTYVYQYEGKNHFYIPDFYIPSLNLEVEIKDGGDNPNNHPKIKNVDKVKESLKDEVMYKSKVNYVKVVNKNYVNFFKALHMLKEQDTNIKSGKPLSEYVYVVESKEQDSVLIDSTSSMLQWFYQQINNASSVTELMNIRSRIDSCIDKAKNLLNAETDDVGEKVVSNLINSLEMARNYAEEKMSKMNK